MFTEQREALDEIVVKMRAGRITRRTFLERATLLGLTGSVAMALLGACSSHIKTIIWESEYDAGNVYSDLVSFFNTDHSSDIHVVYINGPSNSTLQYQELTKILQAGGGSDVLSIDVPWLPEFASKGWILSLEERWPAPEREHYLPGPLQECTFNGHIWAAPFRIDVGLLYYRTDLVINTPPTTWEQLTTQAESIQASGKARYGYVWQGAPYEGLTCNFVEMLYSYGGSVFSSTNPPHVTVNSAQALQALTEMVNWIGTISPTTITTYKEEDARAVWQQGYAAFMRNWTYAYFLGNDNTLSTIAGNFDVHPILPGGGNLVGHSCTGGWHLGINAQSKYSDAAWTFIDYMLGYNSQRYAALIGALTVTLTSIYEDSGVLAKNPFFGKLKPIIQNARSRPISLRYADITKAIYLCINKALMKQSSPANALSILQSDLERITAL